MDQSVTGNLELTIEAKIIRADSSVEELGEISKQTVSQKIAERFKKLISQ
jgi:hypothetical protein